MSASAVAEQARLLDIAVLKPASLKGAAAVEAIREERPDVMVVAAYGLLLPAAVLAIPARGCINIHASLLPRWRGAAPIQRAILAGDATTGVSIMRMDEGLDTGPVLLAREHAMAPRETAGTLSAALAKSGAAAIAEALAAIDSLTPRHQDSTVATYAPKVSKAEARIDWRRSNIAIDRQVRAFDPAPGAEASLAGETIKIWEAAPAAGSGTPGQVLEAEAARLVIACGQGALEVTRIQRPGARRMPVEDFLRGARISRGALLDPISSAA